MALLLRAEHLRVLFGIRTIFDIDTIEIHDGDRIGLVGDNGAGKSTLLSVLHGDRTPDGGQVLRYAKSAMVRQFGQADMADEVDPAIQARLRAKASAHEGISGGEMERLRIAQALSSHTPLLFVDEPTTNLDFDGVAEVRRALAQHRGALVLVSHDRDLLDALCTAIWALDGGKLRIFPGNWSAYHAQMEQEQAHAQFEYEQYRGEQARLRAAIRGVQDKSSAVRKAPKRMGNSEARLHKRGGGAAAKKQLDKASSALQSRLEGLAAKERPREAAQVRMTLEGRGGIASQTAVRAEHLRLAAGGRTLLADASFDIPTGRRTVLIGPNGGGKTTLLRAIRDGAAGIRLSPGAKIGWFGQETLDTLDPTLTLLDNVLRDSILPQGDVRTILARMGLAAGDMQKPAAVLSGGERAKAVLARLMAGDATLLLLDEPANHLDLRALEALESLLADYPGTLLLVSHDRRMIDRVAQRLLVMEGGLLHSFDGNLTAWTAHRQPKPKADAALSEDILRMRMAAALAQLSAPRQKKGFRREAVEAEYEALAAQLRALQSGGGK